jgi:hypothetical protein
LISKGWCRANTLKTSAKCSFSVATYDYPDERRKCARFSDGRLAEIFLTNGKVGCDTAAAARDSAVMCNLALQFGTPVETIRRALLRDAHGVAASLLGRARDLFVASAP